VRGDSAPGFSLAPVTPMRTADYKMFDLNPKMGSLGPQPTPPSKQPRKLLIALALLLVVLAVVLVKDSDFWFSSDDAESEAPNSQTVARAPAAAAPAPAKPSEAAPATAPAPAPSPAAAPVQTAKNPKNLPAPKNQSAPKTSVTLAAKTPSHEDAAKPEAPVVATNRVVLPPLDVEVVAGDKHQTVHPGSNVTVAEITGNANRATKATSAASPATNAAEREPLPASASELRQPLDSTYPLLGQRSRVQGSVVLEAVVGTDGVIENLRVLSGPSILTAAAQQAVRQWRFKPYLQNGQAVETKARITVNFTIRVADNPTKTS
jgi:periplasmic protein TonB